MKSHYQKYVLYLIVIGSFWAAMPRVTVSADMSSASNKLTFTFGCTDGTRDTTVTTNKTPKNTITVSCKNYKNANVDYTDYTTEQYKVNLAITCPTGQNVNLQPTPSAAAAQSVTFSCLKVIGHDANGLPTYAKGSASTPKTGTPTVTANTPSTGGGATQSGIDGSSLPQVPADNTAIRTILNTVFGILGSVAVLVTMIAGLRYILANGDPSKVAQAKNTIIYALVGLVIAVTGFSIVTFVVKGLR